MKLRNRQIHPEFFQDEKVASLNPYARILFTGLWCIADKEGRLEYSPQVIRGLIFPFEPKVDVESLLRELHKSGLAVQYEVENRRYICIPKFLKYQKVHPNEAQSVIPMSDHLITFNYGDDITKGKGKGKGKGKDENVDFIEQVRGTKLDQIKITPEYLKKLKVDFSRIDVDNEILKADLWLTDKPDKKYKRHHSFIRNWIERINVKLPPAPKVKEALATAEEIYKHEEGMNNGT